ncbi:hypothetical protein [Aestuariirhabdus sp. LZHN29]|uniref:hypothetical protein n=1 Tax=Aestuariirhabdus sp. LZHN29 TaxID=3417462 RepID=UPI003CF7C063
MSSRTRTLIAFMAASLCAFVLASVSHSQFVLNELTSLGIVIPADVRALSTVDDLLGLLPSYGVIITLGLGLAFSFTAWLRRHTQLPAKTLYPLAGLTAFATLLVLMQPILDITLIAGARGWFGFTSQCLAGAIAGWVFAALNDLNPGTTRKP